MAAGDLIAARASDARAEAPLAPSTEAGPGSWNLPAGLRSLLADIEAAVGDDLARTVRWLALTPVAAGLALAAVSRSRPGSASPGRGGGSVGSPAARPGPATATPSCATAPATRSPTPPPTTRCPAPTSCSSARARRRHRRPARRRRPDVAHRHPLVDAAGLPRAAGRVRPVPPDPARRRGVRPPRTAAEGRDGAFLCHNQCALGAIPLLEALTTVRECLDDNPDEVVTLIVQDAISPAETADTFAAAGLDAYLHTHALGTSWATLGELIDRGERLVVFAEDEGPPPTWYHHAFAHIQDTPYRFEEPSDFTCARNRGEADASLFLMNHWVPRVAPDRARRCQRERGLRPNYVAVGFYGIGDLIDAVDTLNGVG